MPTAAFSKIRLVALLAAGCSSSGGGGGGNLGPTVSDGGITVVGAAACQETAGLYCRKLFECYASDGEVMYGSVENCLIMDAADCRRAATVPDSNPQRVQAWAACNKALGAQTCDQWRFGGNIEACAIPPGSRQVGAPCADWAQCATSYCQFTLDPNTGSFADCGVCAPLPGEGEECPTDDCATGLRCVEAVPGEKRCTRSIPEGAACRLEGEDLCWRATVCVQDVCTRPLAAGAACVRREQCDGDLRCVNGACGPALAEGAACRSEDESCGTGLGCLNDVCTPKKPEGASCTTDEECLGDQCSIDGVTGKNICFGGNPEAGLGEPCGVAASPAGALITGCQINAFCGKDNRCTLRKPTGGACANDAECAGWLSCQAGKCDERPLPMCK